MLQGERFPSVIEQWRRSYMAFLQGEGYRPFVDAEGDVRFKHEGGNYGIILYDDDPEYVQVSYPNFWLIESQQEHLNALYAASIVSCSHKLVKVFVVSDGTNVSCSIEMVVPNPEVLIRVFDRLLASIQAGTVEFVNCISSLG